MGELSAFGPADGEQLAVLQAAHLVDEDPEQAAAVLRNLQRRSAPLSGEATLVLALALRESMPAEAGQLVAEALAIRPDLVSWVLDDMRFQALMQSPPVRRWLASLRAPGE